MKQLMLILLILTFTISLSAQTKRSKGKNFSKFKTNKKGITKKKIFSLGVLNSRALNLVKPTFPNFGVKGTVNVAIIIDENGKVIEARAYSGHPLLKAVSVKAALESTFQPYELSGKPITVQGLIIYSFVSNNYNWLEIGNAFGNEKFNEMLPSNFTEEKQLYEQYKTDDYENRISILQTLRSLLEAKLVNEPKKIWLFKVGILLKELQSICCREENLEEKIE